MINYSVFMQPNPKYPNEPPKAYAKAQISEVMSFDRFVKHIADHNGVYSRGTVQGVISDMCECLVEMNLEGKKVQLGVLGDFWLSLRCEGAESPEKFTAQNIIGVNVLFTPGEDFENLLGRAQFNTVASRAAQAATLKAEKTGETTVDLEAAKKKPTTANPDNGTTDEETNGNGGSDDNPGGNTGSGGDDDNAGL